MAPNPWESPIGKLPPPSHWGCPFYWTPPERCPFARRPRAGGGEWKASDPQTLLLLWPRELRLLLDVPCPQQPRELQGLAFVQGPSCSRTQYPSNGRCCSRCPPGHKVAAACSGESNTTCIPCEDQHFQANWTKESHCTPHHICNQKAGLIVYRNGSKERNVICRCQEGTHCSSHECNTCRPHTSCGAGEEVQQEGSHANDTLCAPCSPGHFSNASSSTARCQPWSRCQEGQVQKANGTRATDVICEALLLPHEARKSHLLVLLPIAAFLLGALLFLWHRRGKCPRKRHQDLPPEPTENEEDCPAFPTQETLLGEQAGMQEKDCRLAQQEQV